MNQQELLWNVYYVATIVVRKQINFQSAVIRSERSCYWVASMANPVGVCVSCVCFLFFLFFLFFSVSVKVLPVTPLLSGVFVHRAFFAYFLRIERVVGNA